MNAEFLIQLAANIYAVDVAMHDDWDLQKRAKEALRKAMQFALTVQAEQAQGSIDSLVAALYRSHPASPSETELLARAHHQRPLQPGSTTGSAAGTTAQGSTAAEAAATAQGTAPDEGTDSPSTQSQEQDASRGIQTQPFAPYDEHAT